MVIANEGVGIESFEHYQKYVSDKSVSNSK